MWDPVRLWPYSLSCFETREKLRRQLTVHRQTNARADSEAGNGASLHLDLQGDHAAVGYCHLKNGHVDMMSSLALEALFHFAVVGVMLPECKSEQLP
jgi:hypothetical protein